MREGGKKQRKVPVSESYLSRPHAVHPTRGERVRADPSGPPACAERAGAEARPGFVVVGRGGRLLPLGSHGIHPVREEEIIRLLFYDKQVNIELYGTAQKTPT